MAEFAPFSSSSSFSFSSGCDDDDSSSKSSENSLKIWSSPSLEAQSSSSNECTSKEFNIVCKSKPLKMKRRLHMTKEERLVDDERHKQCFRMTFSRLGKNDIRRDYVLMYDNVMNSSDPVFVASFFRDFCTATCLMQDGVPTCLFKIPPLIIHGSDEVAQRLSGVVERYPDSVCRLLSSRIVRKYNKIGSEIILVTRFQGNEVVQDESGCKVKVQGHDMILTKTLHLDEDLRIKGITIVACLSN
eukprot:gene27045-32679_t